MNFRRRAEEEAARQAAIDAGEAEPEAVEPPEEQFYFVFGTCFFPLAHLIHFIH